MVTTRLKLIACLICLAILFGCHSRSKYPVDHAMKSTENSEQGLVGTIIWLKNKRDTIDINFKLVNKYDEPVMITPGSFYLSFNGQISDPWYNKKTVIYPGQAQIFTLVFAFEPEIPEEGTAQFEVRYIHKGTPDKKGAAVPDIKYSLPVPHKMPKKKR